MARLVRPPPRLRRSDRDSARPFKPFVRRVVLHAQRPDTRHLFTTLEHINLLSLPRRRFYRNAQRPGATERVLRDAVGH